jgi:hypothetical protein
MPPASGQADWCLPPICIAEDGCNAVSFKWTSHPEPIGVREGGGVPANEGLPFPASEKPSSK